MDTENKINNGISNSNNLNLNSNKLNYNTNVISINSNEIEINSNINSIKADRNTKELDDTIKSKTLFNRSNKSIFNFVKPYELAFLIIDLIVVITLFIITTEKNPLSFSCSFVGCFAIFFLAKGFFFAPMFNVVYDILYIILSYTQNYFGEAIIYLIMTLPIDIYSTFAWRKNKTKSSNVIKFNKLSKKRVDYVLVGDFLLDNCFLLFT